MKRIKNILSIAFLALLLQSCFLFDREPVSRTQNEELDKKYRQIQGEWSITGYSINGVDAYDSVIKYKMYYPIRFEYDGAPLDQYGYSKNQKCKMVVNDILDTSILYYSNISYGEYQFIDNRSCNSHIYLSMVYPFKIKTKEDTTRAIKSYRNIRGSKYHRLIEFNRNRMVLSPIDSCIELNRNLILTR